jgi:hypothetical protein
MDITKIKSCPQYKPTGVLETTSLNLKDFMPLYNQALRELSYNEIQGFIFLCLPVSLRLEKRGRNASERDVIQQIKGLLSISFDEIEAYKKTLDISALEAYLNN